MDPDEHLTKIYVELPNHCDIGGESMWARPLGGNIYRIQNVPFYAYDLNFLDVVEAVASRPTLIPTVLRVMHRSGHRTIRVIFLNSVAVSDRIPLLETVKSFGASIEGATKKLFALDIEPAGDYDSVRAKLDEWVTEGLLDYETCEARVDGSFDDVPAASG